MEIKVGYKFKNTTDYFYFRLMPEEYYDTLGINESYEKDGVPKFNDAKEYVNNHDKLISIENIEQTIIEIKNSVNNDHSIKTYYLGQGQSMLIYRKDNDGYELIIQSIKITKNCNQITRIERFNNSMDWNISSSIGLNCEPDSIGEEKWYSVTNGEYINGIISEF
jgi:hypothetical protein